MVLNFMFLFFFLTNNSEVFHRDEWIRVFSISEKRKTVGEKAWHGPNLIFSTFYLKYQSLRPIHKILVYWLFPSDREKDVRNNFFSHFGNISRSMESGKRPSTKYAEQYVLNYISIERFRVNDLWPLLSRWLSCKVICHKNEIVQKLFKNASNSTWRSKFPSINFDSSSKRTPKTFHYLRKWLENPRRW